MIDPVLLGEENLWHMLKKTPLPILIYGMGNGTDKILEALGKIGVETADFFASDGFVRGHSFHGKRVLSLSEAEEKHGAFLTLLAFGSSRPDVMAQIRALEETHPLFAPDVPVCGGPLFTADFYREHEPEILRVRELLADDASRAVFDGVLAYKLSGRLSYLRAVETEKDAALSSLLSDGYTAYADLGAYTGDTAEEALRFFPTIRRGIAFEPSPKIYEKLCARLTDFAIPWQAFPLAAWDKRETRSLTDGASRNSSLGEAGAGGKTQSGAKCRLCECDTLDARSCFSGEKLLIKYDVEGAERRALLGSAETIARNETELIVSLYHKSADLYELPLLVHEMLPTHRLFLRKHPSVPAWDVNLYVTK